MQVKTGIESKVLKCTSTCGHGSGFGISTGGQTSMAPNAVCSRGSDIFVQYTALGLNHYACIYPLVQVLLLLLEANVLSEILCSVAMVNSSRAMLRSEPSIKGNFNASYTAANISKSAVPYDFAFFHNLKLKLDDADPMYLKPFSYALLVLTSKFEQSLVIIV